ncbi:MAG: hypothetical protein GC159_20575 [Phycisphaera sp.]|nr:hypothetical protein [Phycisphaera sp.]
MADAKDKPNEPKPIAEIACAHQVSMARWSPDGRHIVAACYDGVIRRWDVTGEKPAELSTLKGHNGWATVVAFAGGGRLLSGDSWGRLTCWDYAKEEPAAVWSHEQAHDGWLRDVALTPDGARVVTCGMDNAVCVHAVTDGKLERRVAGHDDLFAVAVTPDGAGLLAAGMRGVIRQWSLAEGAQVRDLNAEAMYKYDRIQDVGGVRALRFDSGGKRLICAGAQPTKGATVQAIPTVMLFDFETGEASGKREYGKPADGFVHDLTVLGSGDYAMATSGTPGNGMLVMTKPGAEKPDFEDKRYANAHSVSLHVDGKRLLIASTNKGSNGNGRRLDEDGRYIGNHSVIHVLDLS